MKKKKGTKASMVEKMGKKKASNEENVAGGEMQSPDEEKASDETKKVPNRWIRLVTNSCWRRRHRGTRSHLLPLLPLASQQGTMIHLSQVMKR